MSLCWAQAITHALCAWGDSVGGGSLPARAGTEELAGRFCSPSLEWEYADCVRQLPAPQGMENYCWGGLQLEKIIFDAQEQLWNAPSPSCLAFPSHCFLSPLENVIQPVLSHSNLTPINNCPYWECLWRLFPQPGAKWLQLTLPKFL